MCQAGYFTFVETAEWAERLKVSENILRRELLKEGVKLNFAEKSGGDNTNDINIDSSFYWNSFIFNNLQMLRY